MKCGSGKMQWWWIPKTTIISLVSGTLWWRIPRGQPRQNIIWGRFDGAWSLLFCDGCNSIRESIARSPDFYRAWNNLGTLLLGQSRLIEAEQAMMQALNYIPSGTKVTTVLTFVLFSLDSFCRPALCTSIHNHKSWKREIPNSAIWRSWAELPGCHKHLACPSRIEL